METSTKTILTSTTSLKQARIVEGPSGATRPSRVPGYSGITGYSGGTGYSGVPGYSGPTGYSGVSGYSGPTGYSGGSGYSGPKGYLGPTGYSGVSGYSGPTGYSGGSGYSGVAVPSRGPAPTFQTPRTSHYSSTTGTRYPKQPLENDAVWFNKDIELYLGFDFNRVCWYNL